MKLSEAANQVGLTRRMIQEYEKSGLAKKPEKRNKYGHLLYDEKSIDWLWQIRFYREVGYDNVQIRSAVSHDICSDEELEGLIQSLTKEKERLENIISIMTVMKEGGISFNTLRHMTIEEAELQADGVFAGLGMICKYWDFWIDEDNIVDLLTDDECDRLMAELNKIGRCYQKEVSYDDPSVQKIAARVYGICKKKLADSVYVFRGVVSCLRPENKTAQEILEGMSDDAIEYVYNVLRYYCEKKGNSRADREFIDALENVERLAYDQYTIGSEDVQREVKRIHSCFREIKCLTEEAQLELLERIGKLYGSRSYREQFDGGRKRGIAWFISRAIEIYCDHYRREKANENMISQKGEPA